MRIRNLALVLLIACMPPEPNRVGEFPIGLVAFGNSSVLLTRFKKISEERSDLDFRFFLVRSDGTVKPLFSMSAPRFYDTDVLFATTTTDTADGPAVFLLTQFRNTNVYAMRMTNDDTFIQELSLPTVGASVQISLLDRDPDRKWMWISNSNWSTVDFKFPLVEFEGNNISMLATNVLWAHCGNQWCQQLRSEGSAMRLYAAPITADAYLQRVTETTRQGDLTSGRLRTCSLAPEITVVLFENTYYFLSTTEPTLTAVTATLVTKSFPMIMKDCPSFEAEDQDARTLREQFNGLRPQAADFADGTRLTAGALRTGFIDIPDCEWWSRLQNNCHGDTEIYSTSLHFQNSFRKKRFFLHSPGE